MKASRVVDGVVFVGAPVNIAEDEGGAEDEGARGAGGSKVALAEPAESEEVERRGARLIAVPSWLSGGCDSRTIYTINAQRHWPQIAGFERLRRSWVVEPREHFAVRESTYEKRDFDRCATD
jgi:hypothetical protein